MTVSAALWILPFPPYWNTKGGDRMRGSAVVVTGLQGLPSLFRKIEKIPWVMAGLYQSRRRVIWECVFFPVHSSDVFMWLRMNCRCFSSSEVSLAELKVTERSVRKHCPPFSEQTLDHPIALLQGNLNQAIPTKLTQRCWKTEGSVKQKLPIRLKTHWRWEGEEMFF